MFAVQSSQTARHPPPPPFSKHLKGTASHSQLQTGLFALLTSNPTVSTSTATADKNHVINIGAKKGELKRAIRHALFRALALAGHGHKVVDLYRRMNRIGILSDRFIYTYVLKACYRAHILRHGYMGYVHIMTILVDMYARFGRAKCAGIMFAFKLFREMMLKTHDLLPNSVTMARELQACAALAALEKGRLIHGYVLRRDLQTCHEGTLEAWRLQKVPGCSWIEVKRRIYPFASVNELNPQIEQLHSLLLKLSMEIKEDGHKERILLGHSEKLAVAFGLIDSAKGEMIWITKNLRLCEDWHSLTKFISRYTKREILVQDMNHFHHFKDGVCSYGDYW
ncbi:hypothetical protein EUGRSUZ_E00923 [Eucalyptus grandis]|uniref:Uncharacterized protein n=2 Tax=Eucalyptus grandis TaxID=71139 RepID=A0ACC3KTY5_EUCGR|nr:hypothetical protein EUGRSUZ_E00923 [Eucalyptus grandis]